jgi:DNA-binding NarL/FixJ family response regulator
MPTTSRRQMLHPDERQLAPAQIADAVDAGSADQRWRDAAARDLADALSAARASVALCELALARLSLPSPAPTPRSGVAPIGAMPARASDAERLTAREAQILTLIAAGMSNRAIAEALFLSPRTVERHIANLYRKLRVHNRAAAAALAPHRG